MVPCPRPRCRVLGTSRRLCRARAHRALLGDKAPGAAGTPGAGNAAAPPRPPPGGLCPREKQDHGFFLFRDSSSWNAHPLGFAIFTRPSLPVSMATPPNSRFQAAMTSPFPFLPPRPPGPAALDPISRLLPPGCPRLSAPHQGPLLSPPQPRDCSSPSPPRGHSCPPPPHPGAALVPCPPHLGVAGAGAAPVPCWPRQLCLQRPAEAFSLPSERLCWSPVAEGTGPGAGPPSSSGIPAMLAALWELPQA